jgi:RNA polymerase sigma factor (sigma-70 family)
VTDVYELPYDPQWPTINGSQGVISLNLDHDQRELLAEAVDSLPEPLRDVIEGLYWERLSLRQIGERYGISKQAVHKRKKKALRMLQEVLHGEAGV